MDTTFDENELALIRMLNKTILHARQKHPWDKIGIKEAYIALSEEFGEVAKELSKQETGWKTRLDFELLDLMAVAFRILHKDYLS